MELTGVCLTLAIANEVLCATRHILFGLTVLTTTWQQRGCPSSLDGWDARDPYTGYWNDTHEYQDVQGDGFEGPKPSATTGEMSAIDSSTGKLTPSAPMFTGLGPA